MDRTSTFILYDLNIILRCFRQFMLEEKSNVKAKLMAVSLKIIISYNCVLVVVSHKVSYKTFLNPYFFIQQVRRRLITYQFSHLNKRTVI